MAEKPPSAQPLVVVWVSPLNYPRELGYRIERVPDELEQFGIEQQPNQIRQRYAFQKREALMPLYFTHVHDGQKVIRDLEGQHFADDASALNDARMAAREMLAEKLLAGKVVNGQALEVCNADGVTVGIVPLRDELRLGV